MAYRIILTILIIYQKKYTDTEQMTILLRFIAKYKNRLFDIHD